jgi:ATP-dependent Lon protease
VTAFQAPRSPFPLLPLRTGVLLPGAVVTLPVGRERSLALVRDLRPGQIIGVAVQRDSAVPDPRLPDLLEMGVFARVREIGGPNARGRRIVVEGLQRFELEEVVRVEPFLAARGRVVRGEHADPARAEAREELLREQLGQRAEHASEAEARALRGLVEVSDAGLLADRVAIAIGLDDESEVHVLLTRDVGERLALVSRLLDETKTRREIKRRIDGEVRRELHKGQREAMLRQQLRAIRKELGEGDEGDPIDELARRIEEAALPEEVREVADRELARLQQAAGGSPAEAGVIRNYLEWILALPWSARAEQPFTLDAVEEKLDADHHGLQDVKKRILEHLAVVARGGTARGTILCLAGPPGTGKTSLGQSIADAMGRPFVRIALGGVRDEAELRGHRRTYVGALPGRIIHALKTAGVRNPVVLLDEVDKLGRGWMGSPEAALLELLDPEQNHTFTDHYLELPFDMSEALFVCTANDLSTLSPPLRDRLEVIPLDGYTGDEKLSIARSHLVPKLLAEHAIGQDMLRIDDEALGELIRGWTREAGVRQLQRAIRQLCRSLALELARSPDTKPATVAIGVGDLAARLGRRRFHDDVALRTAIPGVATGLAWTPVGGDVLFIETSRMRGGGKLQITGQLGDVMKESAHAALTYVRSNADALGVDADFLDGQDLHIHVPAGAVPKDGPSAGVTMFTALTSLLTGRRVRADTAMTGECTLRGRVLPVGGIKSKVLAAHRAGLERVVLPERNRHDLDEVPERVRDRLEFVFAEDMSQVLEAALEEEPGLPLQPANGMTSAGSRETPAA